MREICFDTETTGRFPEHGDRIVEIGALELIDHIPTGKTFHEYINPEREMSEEEIRRSSEALKKYREQRKLQGENGQI